MLKDTNRLLLLFLIFLKEVLSNTEIANEVLVRTVPFGSRVVLSCSSNDEHHNFQFWHIMNKRLIIGPANNYDRAKFRFEVLTGNLIIKAVSKEEEGVYVCFSRAVNGENINVNIIRLAVQSSCDMVDVFANDVDFQISAIKVLIAAIALVLFSMGAWFGYGIWKRRYKFPGYLNTEDDDDDDESTEELFSQPSTSRSLVNNIVPAKAKSPSKDSSFVDVDISTDFKSILDIANEK